MKQPLEYERMSGENDRMTVSTSYQQLQEQDDQYISVISNSEVNV